MELFRILGIPVLLLLLEDFVATFVYPVPEHVYGDIFTFYEPAQYWLTFLHQVKRQWA